MRGADRAAAAERVKQVGPYIAHQEKLLNAPEPELRDGNITAAPNAHVLRQAAAEKRAKSRYSTKVVEDLNIMMRINQDLDDKSKHLKGDIHFIADAPLLIHIYREESFQRYRTNMTALHLDSTGSITKKVGKTEPYYYALVAERTGTAGQSFPLAHMISERHNVPTIAHFLMQVRSDFRLANGGTAELQPPRIITDCSWALMHAVSTNFNQMSLPSTWMRVGRARWRPPRASQHQPLCSASARRTSAIRCRLRSPSAWVARSGARGSS